MELKNLERAKELIPQLDVLKKAKAMLSEDTSHVLVRDDNGYGVSLPKSVKMNILNAVNYEYERVRKEVSEL